MARDFSSITSATRKTPAFSGRDIRARQTENNSHGCRHLSLYRRHPSKLLSTTAFSSCFCCCDYRSCIPPQFAPSSRDTDFVDIFCEIWQQSGEHGGSRLG